jgi:hypothetical protein
MGRAKKKMLANGLALKLARPGREFKTHAGLYSKYNN